jgi:putative tricarboxylic transport membrane protein
VKSKNSAHESGFIHLQIRIRWNFGSYRVSPSPVNVETSVLVIEDFTILATSAMLILGLSLVKILVKVLTIPREKLMPFIFVLCAVGSYAIANRLFDVLVMVVFGIIGYYMRVMGYPVAPTVLGIILGDILDKNLRRGLILTDGDIIPFFTRPISLVIFLFTLFTILSRMRWFRNLLSAAKIGILHRVSDLGLTSKNMGRR